MLGPARLILGINAAQAQVTLDIQAAANDFGSGRIWVEKVRFLTLRGGWRPAGPDASFDGPLGEIDRLLAELRADPAELTRWAEGELSDLRKKLPPEIREGDGFDFASPGELAGDPRPDPAAPRCPVRRGEGGVELICGSRRSTSGTTARSSTRRCLT